MRIYFVRHGQTEFNKAKIIQGREVDSPLTNEGILGAQQLGSALSNIQFDHVYSSPLGRAVETTYILLKENINPMPNIKLVPQFRELYFGKYEGKPIQDFEQGGQFEAYKSHPDTFDASTTGGETYYDLKERGLSKLTEILKNTKPNDTILIVAHAVFLTTLINSLLGVPMKDIRRKGLLKNTSATIIDFDENLYPNLIKYDWLPK